MIVIFFVEIYAAHMLQKGETWATNLNEQERKQQAELSEIDLEGTVADDISFCDWTEAP